jgi:hypothetical protein
MGGLGMVDIRTSLKVQKINWVRRILQAENGEEWTMIPLKNFKCLDKKYGTEFFVLRVNDTKKNMKLQRMPEFYRQCIETFQDFCDIKKMQTTDDIIWCNKQISFNGRPLEFFHWAKSGLLYVKDIVVNDMINEQFIYDSLLNKAGFYFDVCKLRTSLPLASIKQFISVRNEKPFNSYLDKREYILNTQIESCHGKVPFKKLKSKDISSIILMSKVDKLDIKSKRYWQEKFQDHDIDFSMWYLCNFLNYLTPRKCKDFNWKLFYGLINIEARLLKMNISNGLCKVCKSSLENLEHLLYDCNYVKKIWNSIFQECLILWNIEQDKIVILAGVLENSNESMVVNMILSLCRWIIWKRRNILKFENKYLDEETTIIWIRQEIVSHCITLLKCRLIKENGKYVSILKKILNVYVQD